LLNGDERPLLADSASLSAASRWTRAIACTPA